MERERGSCLHDHASGPMYGVSAGRRNFVNAEGGASELLSMRLCECHEVLNN